MRSKYLLIVFVLLALAFGVGRLSAAPGTLDSPAPPGSTSSYSLADVYNRLDSGAAGAQSTFTEPSSGPMVGTGHTLNEIMAIAPEVDATHGASQPHVLEGKPFWGLTSGQWGLITGTAVVVPVPAPVPKTGQTASYATGDDGDLERGIAWPNPRFTDNGDGTVTDNLTGLTWLKNANCFGSKTWDQALSDANTLDSGECGLGDGSVEGDWRLPNVRELHSLVDYGRYTPALPAGHPFTGVQSSGYWSSTTLTYVTSDAWTVGIGVGTVYSNPKGSGPYVWPVRGEQ